MESTFDAPPNDLIAMSLTIAALDQWLKNVSPDGTGEELGREVGALYREIHLVVDEMSPIEDDENDDEHITTSTSTTTDASAERRTT